MRDANCLHDHLDARAAIEPRLSEVIGAEGAVRRCAEPGHTRLLATTLGRVEVTRIAYRMPGVSNLHPADVELALPAGWYSFPLQRQVVHETVTGALRKAYDTLDREAPPATVDPFTDAVFEAKESATSTTPNSTARYETLSISTRAAGRRPNASHPSNQPGERWWSPH